MTATLRAVLLVVVATATIFLTGCQSDPMSGPVLAGATKGEVRPGDLTETCEAAEFAVVRELSCDDVEVARRRLKRGDAIGFVRDEQGRVLAVAGEEKFLLPDAADTRYVWRGGHPPPPDFSPLVEFIAHSPVIPVAIVLQTLHILLTGSTKC